MVEQITGENLDSWLKKTFYEPLGMTHITYNPLQHGFAKDDCAATVIIASGGYPGSYAKGKAITGLDEAAKVPGATVFHCGTKAADGQTLTAGGRVLSVTGMGATLREAVDTAYRAVGSISFENAFYRHDIAHRAFERNGR